MDLIKQEWSNLDKIEFIKYLESLKNQEKIVWTQNIVNTKMKVLAIKSREIKQIAKEIKKGNYISFLDLGINDYYENISINGTLICQIKDFEQMKKYLDKYVLTLDNWAVCDLLKFNIKNNEENFWNLSQEYINSKLPFVRRVGILILFEFILRDDYINKIYEVLDMFQSEEEYYVNMVNAWLFCELFIKRREMTLKYLDNHKLNKFTINKGISKCRDSYRVSVEDKEYLLKFKK